MPFKPVVPAATLKKPEIQMHEEQPATMAGDPKQNMQHFLECIAQYKKLGSALKRATTMQEVGIKLSEIAELAEQAVVTEAGDWYDEHTLRRHMKEAKAYSGEFSKLSAEADQINERMSALYEDMGRVLERYFELPDDEIPGSSSSDTASVPSNAPDRERVSMTEVHPGILNPSEPPLPTTAIDGGHTPNTDILTLRAIKAVYETLREKNPEMASKFANMSPKLMKRLVWKLVR